MIPTPTTDLPEPKKSRKAYMAQITRVRREKMRAAGICVNGWSHGAAVKGGRCQACWDKKKAGERDRQRGYTASLHATEETAA